jgi:ribA/ribD-fused uncharacterized protein
MMSGVPKEEPLWFAEMKEQLSEITLISANVAKIDKSLNDIIQSVDANSDKLTELTEQLKAVKSENSELKLCNSALKNEVGNLKKQVMYLECQSRRNNLLFDGVGEKVNEKWHECEAALKTKLQELLGVHVNVDNLQFERVHRVGQKVGISPRQIVAKFSCYKQRDLVWSNRFNLPPSQTTGFWINEDFPYEVKQNRDKLRPLLHAAKRDPSLTSSLKLDRLFVNNKAYTVETIDQLPEHLQPKNASIISTDDVVVFSSSAALFSNLFPCKFVIEGTAFNSTEQYIQYAKSILFNDTVSAQKIMQEVDGYRQMKLGKNIKHFKKEIWHGKVEEVMMRANLAKYNQNPDAKLSLLQTGKKILGEATVDPFFGIGQRLSSKSVTDFSTWKGKNLMGTVLADVRTRLDTQ